MKLFKNDKKSYPLIINEFMNTNLFQKISGPSNHKMYYVLRLINTDIVFYIFVLGDKIESILMRMTKCKKPGFSKDAKKLDKKEFMSFLPKEIQRKLIFNLDLFI